jgi:3-oxoacyl-[acyl-carrier protein] reductase
MVITGTRKGIGNYLATYYAAREFQVIGCSRNPLDYQVKNYQHFSVDVTDEPGVQKMFLEIRRQYGRLDVLINNAGIASMNHVLLTPLETVQKVLHTNVAGTFLFSREAAKLMKKNYFGRIVNFTSIATPLKLEGEAIYASSKAAVITLTQILARELAEFNITVNAIGPTPIDTDLIRVVPKEKIDDLVNRQAIRRLGEFRDVANVIDFFILPESDFITGQVIFLGGI